MKNTITKICGIIAAAGICSSAHGQGISSHSADLLITPLNNTTFSDISTSVWSWSASIFFPIGQDCCNGSYSRLDVDADFGQALSNANSWAGYCTPQIEFGVRASAFSDMQAFGPNLIWWSGHYNGIGAGERYHPVTGEPHSCNPFLEITAGTYGAFIDFTSSGPFLFESNGAVTSSPSRQVSSSTGGRRVDSSIFDLGPFAIASSITYHNGAEVVSPTPPNVNLPAGSYSMRTVTGLSIEDDVHDVNDDFRFNQDDVDYLNNNVVGTTSDTEEKYVELFDFQGNGFVDADDTAILQSFVNAGLDARRIGDANLDNIIDCDDVLKMGTQAFAGEDVQSASYNVGFDVDLDGDNDLVDKDALIIVMLEIEPADFSTNGYINDDDFFAFLNFLFAKDPRADLNNDGLFTDKDMAIFWDYYNNPQCSGL